MRENLRFLDAGLEAIERLASANSNLTSSGYACGHIRVIALCLRSRLGNAITARRDPKTGRFMVHDERDTAKTGRA